MNISVEYIDPAGTVTNPIYPISRLALIKHMAIAGQGYAPTPTKFLRTLAMFLHYSYYLQNHAFNDDRFSEPPIQFSDPTEKGQFSNIVGKAIADFLSKRIDNSLFTVNYEAAMRLRGMLLNVGRPDLIAYTRNSMFALEAKGFSGGCGNMATHKNQSRTGGIPVNFTVACISYDLYNNVKCNYHDPYNENVSYDNVTLRGLTRNYYNGLIGFLDRKFFEFQEITLQGENFYEIDLSYGFFGNIFQEEFPFFPLRFFDNLRYFRPKLILPTSIRDFAINGFTNELRPFNFENKEQDQYLYVDNDRVGLRIM